MSDVAIRGAAPPYLLPRQRIYLEQPERRETALDAIAVAAHAELVAASGRRRAKRLSRILPLVERHADEYRAMATEDIPAAVRDVATALRRTTDFPDATTARAFALIRELSERILGKRHFDVQVVGAFAMIKGMLAENGDRRG